MATGGGDYYWFTSILFHKYLITLIYYTQLIKTHLPFRFRVYTSVNLPNKEYTLIFHENEH